MKAWSSALPLALCAGCAIDAGQGFASLEPGELHAAFEPGEVRELADGAVLTDRGYRVQVQSLTVRARELSLLAVEAEVDGRCDDDHCHDEGGGDREGGDEHVEGFVPIVRMPIERELDVLAGAHVELDGFEPSSELGLTTLDRAELELDRLDVSATVEGPGLAEPRAFTAQLATAETLDAPLAVTIDRDSPEQLAPRAWLRFDATLFDEIDFGALEVDEAGAAAVALEGLGEASLIVELDHDHDHED